MLTKPWKRKESRCRGVDGEVQAAGRGAAHGGGRSRGALARLIHQEGPCGPCGGVQGVSVAGGSPAAWNHTKSSSPAVAVSGEIPALGRLLSITRSLVRSLTSMRGFCGAWQGLGGGGVAGMRRHREVCASG